MNQEVDLFTKVCAGLLIVIGVGTAIAVIIKPLFN